MPFHVYEGLTGRLITTIVRPGLVPRKEAIIALLKRIVRRIRARFPDTLIVFRADSHHTKASVLDWLERHDVRYILGVQTNAVLRRETAPSVDEVDTIRLRLLKVAARVESGKTFVRLHLPSTAALLFVRTAQMHRRSTETELVNRLPRPLSQRGLGEVCPHVARVLLKPSANGRRCHENGFEARKTFVFFVLFVVYELIRLKT